MKITFVKKILKTGAPCSKCKDVEARLMAENQMSFINQVLVADERDPESAGMQVAKHHNVDRAPFFVVEDGGDVKVYTVYFKFVKEVLGSALGSEDEAKEILNDHPDLDYI